MAEKQSTKSTLWSTTTGLLLSVLLSQALGQTSNQLEEMNYDWSTFLLLVIPVLIILVVLVLCVTGVFMFCLSTLTISYDQDYIGHITGAQAMPECRHSLPSPNLDNKRDCLNQTQSLPISEEVKLKVEELKELDCVSIKSEDCMEKERTDLGFEQEIDLKEEKNVPMPSGTGRFKQVEIEMEQNREKDEATVPNDTISKHFTSSWVYPYTPDFLAVHAKNEHPMLAPANFPTLQLLSMKYFQPQKELCLADSVGVRG